MNRVQIVVTMPQNAVFDTFFDKSAKQTLEALGTVRWNTLGRQYTGPERLCDRLGNRHI